MQKVILSNDHGALELKLEVRSFLKSQNLQVVDMGVNSDESVDYPDMAEKCCKEYLSNPDEYLFGILLCGTGIGISMAANKIKGIRCALPQNIFAAQMAKEHNNANFLAFGGRIKYSDSVSDMIEAFMKSNFSGDRHSRRVEKITALEGK